MEEIPQKPSPKLATQCPHLDRPEKARGMCQPCYRAWHKAEDIRTGKVKLDEETLGEVKTQSAVERDFVNDPEAVREFYRIMWAWLHAAAEEKPIITTDSKGKSKRDFALEVRLRESHDQRAMKAATVLGRAYIVERHAEEKPAELPVDGINSIAANWLAIGEKGKRDRKSDA